MLLPERTGQWEKVASQGKVQNKTYEYEIPLLQNLINKMYQSVYNAVGLRMSKQKQNHVPFMGYKNIDYEYRSRSMETSCRL